MLEIVPGDDSNPETDRYAMMSHALLLAYIGQKIGCARDI